MIYLPYFGMSDDMREHIYAQTYGFIPYIFLQHARENWWFVSWSELNEWGLVNHG